MPYNWLGDRSPANLNPHGALRDIEIRQEGVQRVVVTQQVGFFQLCPLIDEAVFQLVESACAYVRQNVVADRRLFHCRACR